MKYRIRRIPGGYRASLHVPMGKDREIVFSASAYERDVRKALAKGDPEVGFSLKSLGRSVKKLTRSKALRKAVRTTLKTAKSPAFTMALTAVNPAVGIGLTSSLKGLGAAEKLLSNATKAPKGSCKRIAARATIKAAQLVAKQEDKTPKRKSVPRPAGRKSRGVAAKKTPAAQAKHTAMKYLVQVVPS